MGQVVFLFKKSSEGSSLLLMSYRIVLSGY